MIVFSSFFLVNSFLFSNVFAEVGVNFTNPLLLKPGWAFQGQYEGNAKTVKLVPKIGAIPIKGVSKSMLICGYTVHHESISFLPFVVIILDKEFGNAEIRLKENVSKGSLEEMYTFQIEAYDCDDIPHFSERKFVLIEFKTAEKPMFSSTSYHFSSKSNTPVGTKIGSITAFERPNIKILNKGSQGICKYAIKSSSQVPFAINAYGELSTIELLSVKTGSIKYKFAVEASDCRKPVARKNTVMVMVDVSDDCQPHWTGLPSIVEYNGEAGVVPIVLSKAVAPSLHVCSNDCEDMLAIVNVKLQGKDLRPANASLCKHDHQSLKRQEKLCDISKNGIDMLTTVHEFLKDIDNGGFYFPGDSAVFADPKFSKLGHALRNKFTIMFWMKHAEMEVKGVKEQILCNSDGQDHNRHHFSLFLHNCKLILLLRKENGDVPQDRYEPSEWRYGPLKEVCDNKWHHYSIQFNNGIVFVQIDGEITKEQPQYLDDKPMIEFTNKKSDTKFTVAACYHAKSNAFVQFFKGHLASLKIFEDHLEAINNIRCIATCGEALLLPHIVDVVGMQSSVTLFSDTAVIRSHDIFNLLQMFSGLSYINTEISNEIHGTQMINRTVAIDVTISCRGKAASKAEQRSITIHLSRPLVKNQNIRIRCTTNILGIQNEKTPLFKNLQFVKDDGVSDSLQSCIVRPVGQPIQKWESIEWPINVAINLHLTGLNNSHGLVLEGPQLFVVYEMVLRKTYYMTRKDNSREEKRKFAVVCSSVDRSVTNEVIVTVEVQGKNLKTYYVVDDPNQNKEDLPNVLKPEAGDGRVGFEERKEITKKKTKKDAPSPLPYILAASGLIVLIGAVVGVVLFLKKKFPPKKLFLNDIEEQSRHRRIRLTHNASYGKKSLQAETEIADDDDDDDESLTNGIPDSEGDDDDDDAELENEERTARITIPNFVRIPSTARMHPVDV